MTKNIGPDQTRNVNSTKSSRNDKLGIELLADRLAQSDTHDDVKNENIQDNMQSNLSSKKSSFKSMITTNSESESDDDILVKKTSNLNHELLDDLVCILSFNCLSIMFFGKV